MRMGDGQEEKEKDTEEEKEGGEESLSRREPHRKSKRKRQGIVERTGSSNGRSRRLEEENGEEAVRQEGREKGRVTDSYNIKALKPYESLDIHAAANMINESMKRKQTGSEASKQASTQGSMQASIKHDTLTDNSKRVGAFAVCRFNASDSK